MLQKIFECMNDIMVEGRKLYDEELYTYILPFMLLRVLKLKNILWAGLLALMDVQRCMQSFSWETSAYMRG